MPKPAGTGLPRRSFLLASAGVMLSVYGAGNGRRAVLTEGIAGAGEHPAGRSSSPSTYRAGGTPCRSWRRPATRSTARSPDAGAAPPRGTFSEDSRLQWHPSTAPSRRCTARASSRSSPRSATTTPTSRTSPAATTGRSAPSTRSVGPAGSAATSTRPAHGQPAAGAVARRALQPALATAPCRSRRSTHPSSYTFNATGVAADPARGPDVRSAYSLGGVHGAAHDHGARRRARRPSRPTTLRGQLAPFGARPHTPAATRSRPTTFPHQLASLAAMLTAGLPLECVALRRPAATTPTTTRRPGWLQRARQTPPTRCSPSSATSRRAASTAAC